jgi:ABC-type multidrug transport system fused ATPase/permease subunit
MVLIRDDTHWLVTHIIAFVTLLLSISGCLFIIVTYLRFKKLHTKIGLYVFCLSLSDLIYTIHKLIDHMYSLITGHLPPGGGCRYLGWIAAVSQHWAIAWVLIIALSLFFILIHFHGHGRPPSESKKALYIEIGIAMFFGWLVPILADLPVIIGTDFVSAGRSGFSCWYDDTKPWGQFVWYTIPVFIVLVISVCVYIYAIFSIRKNIMSQIKRMGTSEKSNIKGRLVRKMAIYPLIFIFQWLGEFIRVILLISETPSPKEFDYVVVAMLNLGGLLNAIAYGWTESLHDEYKESLSCSKKKKNQRKNIRSFLASLFSILLVISIPIFAAISLAIGIATQPPAGSAVAITSSTVIPAPIDGLGRGFKLLQQLDCK